MPKAAVHRVLAPCPKCRNRDPKEVVGTTGRGTKLYCANCGHDFAFRQGMGVASLLFAALALLVTAAVIKLKVIEPRDKSNIEVVEIEGVTANPSPEKQWVAHDPRVSSGQPIVFPTPRKAAPTPNLTPTERDIRKEWGWDSKGTSLNQPGK